MSKNYKISVLIVIFVLFLIGILPGKKARSQDIIPRAYLPIVSKTCVAYSDGFSDPNSGWPIEDRTYGTVGYAEGEYFARTKNVGHLIASLAPDASRIGYTVGVDAAWASGSATDGIYALVFGSNVDKSKYYFLGVRPDSQLFRLYFFDASLPVADRLRGIMPWTSSTVINTGSGMNRLQVTRTGSDIDVYINGTSLGSWSDSAQTGATYTGVMATSNPAHVVAEARFDNFAVSVCDASGDPINSQTALENPKNGSIGGEEDQVDLDW